MLVLTGNECDFIKLVIPPSDQEQTVLVGIASIRGNRVRLGVVAKKEINVGRGKRFDRIGDHLSPVESELAKIPTVGSPR